MQVYRIQAEIILSVQKGQERFRRTRKGAATARGKLWFRGRCRLLKELRSKGE